MSADGLQKVDYKYNVRGWLIDINSIASLDEDTGHDDLFSFGISYEDPQEGIAGVEGLYNGNISETYWRTANDGVARMYGYTYDALNRFLTGTYRRTETVGEQMNSYGEMLTYDKNGNIQTLVRNGMYDDTVDYLEMDLLAYEYDTHSGNRLLKVTDDSNDSAGFDDDSDGTNDLHPDYAYDANGNMVSDENKDIMEITYNHLNLPLKITFGGEVTKKIEYLYDAAGVKVQKMVTDDAVVAITDYLGGYQYVDEVLQYFPTDEGYVKSTLVNDVNHYNYVYNYTDLSGNIRLSYGWDETEQSLKILEENNYYPFGLKHSNYNFDEKQYQESISGGVKIEDVVGGVGSYKVKFQGQERQDELGLNWDSFKYRNYDYAMGRFMSIDPLAEDYTYNSTYAFQENKMGMGRELEGLELDMSAKYAPQQTQQKTQPDEPNLVERAFANFFLNYVVAVSDLGVKVDGAKSGTMEENLSHAGSGFLFIVDTSLFIEGVTTINRAPSDGEMTVGYSKSPTTVSATSSKAVNGNSKSSTNLQHGYEITNETNGTRHKVGVSGGKLNKDGTSRRANSQVNKLNKKGNSTYKADVKVKNVPSRTGILNWEQNEVNTHHQNTGTTAPGQKRPKPTGT